MERPHGVTLRRYLEQYPGNLVQTLLSADHENGGGFFLVGGTVRDYLLRRQGADLDLAVDGDVEKWARYLARRVANLTVVDLSTETEPTFRLAGPGVQVDLAGFRGGAISIDQDLRLRDFTINAMAISLGGVDADAGVPLIDPLSGLDDLQAGRIRHCPGAFTADPVRLLRGYRFAGTLGFTIDPLTRQAIGVHVGATSRVAAERLNHELQLLFRVPKISAILGMMDEDGLLGELLPELHRGKGVVQPEFHHEDVFAHSLSVLSRLEEVMADPARFFPDQRELIAHWLDAGRAACLRWAALLHDVGKPVTRQVQTGDEGERITFYRHDEVGAEICYTIGNRLRWRNTDREWIARLVSMHMHPFHLCNVRRAGRDLSRRAALRLYRRAGELLAGVFLLAMADSLAGEGEKKPAGLEQELSDLFNRVVTVYEQYIRPVDESPKLLTGKDLIEIFRLEPGPQFRVILDELAVARIEGRVNSREEALNWVDVHYAGR